MITIVLLVVSLIIAGVMIFKGISNDDTVSLRNGIIVGVLGIIISLVQPFSTERVDTGNVGIKVNLTGDARGVSKYEYKTGWVVYNTWTETMYEFPVFQQHIEYGDQMVITKGGFTTTINPTFNYKLKSNTVGDMFQNLRLPIKEVEQGWLKNAIVGAVNDVANTWSVDSIFNHRENFEANIVVECNKRLIKWFDVSQLRTNITPPEALQESIIAKTRGIQQAEASKQQAIAAQADGQRKVAVAKADSAETVINASAKARAMELTQQKLTPLYVEYEKIEKWDGQLPSTVAGGTGTFLNIK